MTLTAQADGAVTQATLVIMPDEHCDQMQSLPMTKSPNGYTVTFTPPNAGLWFYHFELQSDNGRERFGAVGGGFGGLGQLYPENVDVVNYQMTVVTAFDPVPAWYQNARFYHIFVDRFNNGNADGHVNARRKTLFCMGEKPIGPCIFAGTMARSFAGIFTAVI